MNTGPIAVIVAGRIAGDMAAFLTTTFASHALVSYDRIAAEWTAIQKSQPPPLATWTEFLERIRAVLEKGDNLVVDPPPGRTDQRRQLVRVCREAGAGEVVGLWFKSSLETWHSQCRPARWRDPIPPPGVTAYMWRDDHKHPPGPDDGFDSVVEIEA